MNIMRVSGMALFAVGLALGTTDVNAQHHRPQHSRPQHSRPQHSRPQHSRPQYSGPSYRIDRHENIIRDSHGAVIGQYRQDVIHRGSTYIVPHTGSQHRGSYYVHEDKYYYYPQTAGMTGAHAAEHPRQVPFGGFTQADDLAGRLETLANEFCLDLSYNYSHNPGFQDTYREAYQVLEVAKYIHVAKHRHDREAVRERLGGVDKLFHHVQGEVRGWRRDHHRQVGSLGILSKMDLIESTMHHLMNDVGVRPTPAEGGEHSLPPAAH